MRSLLYILFLVIALPVYLAGQGLIIPQNGYLTSKGTIVLQGNWVNNGVFRHDSGTVVFNGTSQSISGTSSATFNNITIGNGGTTTISSGGQSLKGILLSNGTLHANGNLTLLSTAAQTALIDGSGIGEVLGNVTMQRYLASGFGYKYFSSPFQNATVGEFADDIDLAAAFPVFYRYDQSLASAGWVRYVNPAGPLAAMAGYTANFGASAAEKTADMTGVVNNHTVNAPTLYNHNQPYTRGFNLVGNPYPSPVDWDLSEGWSRTSIDDAVYYFNAGAANQYTGTYSSYINGVSSDGTAGNVIAAMQGFFIHVSDGAYPVAATLSVNNKARVNNLVPSFRRVWPVTAPLIRLTASFADERYRPDHMVVYFEDAAKTAFEQRQDALKMLNTDSLVPSLYAISSDAGRLSICAWPTVRDSSSAIPLGLQTNRRGWVTFEAPAIERLPAGWNIYLYDNKAGITMELEHELPYRLYLEAGKYDDRFSLVFQRKTKQEPGRTGNSVFNAFSVNGKLYASMDKVAGEKCSISVVNLLGQVVLRRDLTGNGRHELDAPFSSGIYIVSFYAPQHQFSKKVFISR